MPTQFTSIRAIKLSAFFAAFVFLTSGCINSLDRLDRIEPGQQEQQEQRTSDGRYEKVSSNDPVEQSLLDSVHTLFRQHDFQRLEELGSGFAKNKERLKGGVWKSYVFDHALESPDVDQADAAAWESHLATLNEWTQKLPDSILAKTALANAYIQYAWYARGDGYANSVKAENWQKYKDRIERASEIVKDATQMHPSYTGYFDLLLTLAIAQGWDRSSYDAVFDAAVRLEPAYEHFYIEKAVYLLPRWNGDPGEWEDFADKVRTDLGENEGLKMYFVLVTVISTYYGTNFFDQNRVSWQSTKKGYELYKTDLGMNRRKLNQFGRLAVHASDPQMACTVFKQLQGDNDYEPEIWGDRKTFEGYKAIAAQFCKTPHINNAKPRD